MNFLLKPLLFLHHLIFFIASIPLLILSMIMGLNEKLFNFIEIQNNRKFESPIINFKLGRTSDPFKKVVYGVGPIYDEIFTECRKYADGLITYHNEILDEKNILLTIIQSSKKSLDDSVIVVSESMVEHINFMLDPKSEGAQEYTGHKFLGYKKGTKVRIYSTLSTTLFHGNKIIIGPMFGSDKFDCSIKKYDYQAGTYYLESDLPENISDTYDCFEFTDDGYTIEDISF